MTRIALDILLALALLAAAAALGWSWRGERAQVAITAAKVDTATCVAGAAGSDAALDTVDKHLMEQREQRSAALATAEKAVADRPAAVTATLERARRRATALAQSPHEDADCAALADLPVCHAIARELWPVAAQAAGADAAHRD